MIRWSNNLQTPPAPSTEVLQAAEERAYGLLEECRLRAAQLLGTHALDEFHRHIGLAGYHVSAVMQTGIRQQCLARAHEQVDDDGIADPPASRDALAQGVDGAIRAIAEALNASPSHDHLHLAQKHALAARETMRGPVLPRRLGGVPGTR